MSPNETPFTPSYAPAELSQWLEENKTMLVAEVKKPSRGRPMAATLQELWQEREKVRQANSERSKAAHARPKAKREAERG